ncbi:uncharacterized protein [Engystomops pustulosus]|uniref:uncharacterized protein n=1 Tax=Engystomops pustulosus TaxID=76066 RepID=UPI003AFB6FC0
MATDDAIRQRLRAEGSAWLSSLLAEAQATDLAPSAPPSQDVRRSGRLTRPPQRLSPSAQAAVSTPLPAAAPSPAARTPAPPSPHHRNGGRNPSLSPRPEAVRREESPDFIPPTPVPARSSAGRSRRPIVSVAAGSGGVNPPPRAASRGCVATRTAARSSSSIRPTSRHYPALALAQGPGAAGLHLPSQPPALARNVHPWHPQDLSVNPQPSSILGPTDPDEGAASEEDIIGSEFSPLDPNTLVVPPPLVAPLMAGELGTGYVLAQGQRRASSVRSRASSSRSRRSSSSRRRRASRSRSGREKRRRSRGRRSASRSGSSRSSQRASSGSSGTPSPKRQHGGSRSRGSSVRSHRSSREQVSGPSAALAMAAPGRSSSAPRPASASGVSIPLPSGGCGRDSVPGFPVVNSGSQLRALVQSSLAPSTWTAYDSRPTVWILGHSFIYWAEQRAMVRPGGRSLGFFDADVRWRGIKGLRWMQALPEVVDISRYSVSPSILVLHLGGNDLCSVRFGELVPLIQSDLERFSSFFSRFVLVWSEIIPRAIWEGARDGAGIERSRRLLNTKVSRFVRERGGVVVRHRELEGDNRGLLLPDGVHLTDIGMDIFLSGLQDGIERAMSLLVGGRRDM